MVTWNAQKDQIILKGIFKFHDIKSGAPLLKYLAEQIGEGCTPKAVSHRLNNIRNSGTPCANTSARSTPASTPKRTPVKITPRSRVKISKKQVSDESGSSTGAMDDDEDVVSPSAARVKRGLSGGARKSYAELESEEDESTPSKKRFKYEPFDDDDSSYDTVENGITAEDDDEV
ncbi:hypothetical protein ACN47E_005212 [Coniothyrium glycines]